MKKPSLEEMKAKWKADWDRLEKAEIEKIKKEPDWDPDPAMSKIWEEQEDMELDAIGRALDRVNLEKKTKTVKKDGRR